MLFFIHSRVIIQSFEGELVVPPVRSVGGISTTLIQFPVESGYTRGTVNKTKITVTNEIFEVYPAGSLPKSSEGRNAYKNNWRRNSPSEIKSQKK